MYDILIYANKSYENDILALLAGLTINNSNNILVLDDKCSVNARKTFVEYSKQGILRVISTRSEIGVCKGYVKLLQLSKLSESILLFPLCTGFDMLNNDDIIFTKNFFAVSNKYRSSIINYMPSIDLPYIGLYLATNLATDCINSVKFEFSQCRFTELEPYLIELLKNSSITARTRSSPFIEKIKDVCIDFDELRLNEISSKCMTYIST